VDLLGGLDILVNNAGVCVFQHEWGLDMLELTEEEWDYVMTTNLKSVFFLSQAAANHMLAHGVQGNILNISSVAAYEPVSGPYGAFSTPNAKGGFGFTGGGGDFGNRYAWYVRVVQQKVSENWLKYEVDPSVSTAQRVYIAFDITRSGQPTGVRVEQSSGVPSLDQSAVRALQRIDTFGPLPNDYPGNRVSVEF
jgi:TonB family protein